MVACGPCDSGGPLPMAVRAASTQGCQQTPRVAWLSPGPRQSEPSSVQLRAERDPHGARGPGRSWQQSLHHMDLRPQSPRQLPTDP